MSSSSTTRTASSSSQTNPTATVGLGPKASLWQWLTKAAPTILVVGVLVVLALWGHSTNWSLPKFSAILGGDAEKAEDWCKLHNVPESQCIECNQGLIAPAKDYGWCREHGVAQCPLDHPEVAQLKTIPQIESEDLERASRALALRPRNENNSRCKLHQRYIQFASVQALDKAGVDIAVVAQRPIVEAITANGEVVYDQTRLAHLTSRVVGTVWRVTGQLGDKVRKGDVLAIIDAADVGKTKAEFLQAIVQQRLKKANVERVRPLAKDGGVSGRQLREAEAALEEAKIRLIEAQQTLVNLGFAVRADDFSQTNTEEIAERIRLLGIPSDMIADLDEEIPTSNLFPIRAPMDGVIVTRDIVPGEAVDTRTTIFAVADVRQMWLTLDVRQDDAKFLSVGQTVLFRPSGDKDDPEVKGSLAWISTEADDQTRTIKVRVNLPNEKGRLRANTFGTGRIVLREESRATVIPSEAVHSDGDCQVVFVRDKNFLNKDALKFFHIREVRTGVKSGDTTEIIVGLLPGEVIASKNSVVLEAQLLKSNLGEGCGCCAPAK